MRNIGSSNDGIVVEYRPTLEGLGESADLVLSQAVMEHVDDFADEYVNMYGALAAGGVTSHHIDFKSHHFARDWNGHWALSQTAWAISRGRRAYAINRAPLYEHVAALQAAGFDGVTFERRVRPSSLTRADLQPRFAELPEEDLTTSSALVQAIKR